MSEVIDHVGIRVSDLATSRRMYEAALAELGFAVLGEGEFEGDAYVLFGRGTNDDFALHALGTEPGRDRVTTGAHIAFRAPDTVSVERWHAAAIDNGGTDNGAPGVVPSTAAATTLRSRSTRTATTSKLCSTHLSRP
jgi:catechol 2,3-dioxygenase-like lactoylglutathione lyase family enzyme